MPRGQQQLDAWGMQTQPLLFKQVKKRGQSLIQVGIIVSSGTPQAMSDCILAHQFFVQCYPMVFDLCEQLESFTKKSWFHKAPYILCGKWSYFGFSLIDKCIVVPILHNSQRHL